MELKKASFLNPVFTDSKQGQSLGFVSAHFSGVLFVGDKIAYLCAFAVKKNSRIAFCGFCNRLNDKGYVIRIASVVGYSEYLEKYRFKKRIGLSPESGKVIFYERVPQ